MYIIGYLHFAIKMHYILVDRLLLFDLHSPDASWYWGTYACDDACVVVNEQYGLLRLHMKRTEYRTYDGGVIGWACVVACTRTWRIACDARVRAGW